MKDRAQGHVVWLWRCECGNELYSPGAWVKCGNTKSCGCLARETRSESVRTHGLSTDPLHSRWRSVRKRCNTPTAKGYENYGGRGIKMCTEWDDFSKFYEWARSSGYEPHLSLERIDVNKGYNPQNCCWIPLPQQARNRRSNKLTIDDASSIKGAQGTMRAIAKRYGVSAALVGQIKRGEKWKDA